MHNHNQPSNNNQSNNQFNNPFTWGEHPHEEVIGFDKDSVNKLIWEEMKLTMDSALGLTPEQPWHVANGVFYTESVSYKDVQANIDKLAKASSETALQMVPPNAEIAWIAGINLNNAPPPVLTAIANLQAQLAMWQEQITVCQTQPESQN